jgi:putative two-component system response regulator
MMDQDDLEELVELEDLEELSEPYNVEEHIPGSSYLLEKKEVLFLKKSYQNAPVAAAILDNNLRILWSNPAFIETFLQHRSDTVIQLLLLFQPYLAIQDISSILRTLKNAESGFSWYGRVEAHGKEFLAIIANMIITPFQFDNSLPEGYLAVFDNVTEENKTLLTSIFKSLLEASRLKDNDTGYHIDRVGAYSKLMAEHLYHKPGYEEIDKEFIENIRFLAPMHDVGKIGTPDDILNKAGPLDALEWVTMQEHTKNGAYILNSHPSPMAKDIAIFHHEKWDGSGYPYGIVGLKIPLPARMVAIADVYDALRSRRSYKEGFSHKKAVDIMESGGGSHFDPALLDLFLELNEDYANIWNRLRDPEKQKPEE